MYKDAIHWKLIHDFFPKFSCRSPKNCSQLQQDSVSRLPETLCAPSHVPTSALDGTCRTRPVSASLKVSFRMRFVPRYRVPSPCTAVSSVSRGMMGTWYSPLFAAVFFFFLVSFFPSVLEFTTNFLFSWAPPVNIEKVGSVPPPLHVPARTLSATRKEGCPLLPPTHNYCQKTVTSSTTPKRHFGPSEHLPFLSRHCLVSPSPCPCK